MSFWNVVKGLLGLGARKAAETAVDAVARRLNEVRDDNTPRELPPIDVGEKVRKVPRPPPRGLK